MPGTCSACSLPSLIDRVAMPKIAGLTDLSSADCAAPQLTSRQTGAGLLGAQAGPPAAWSHSVIDHRS